MAWLSVLISVLTVLAHARLTRVITEDTITAPIRNWINMKAQPRPTRPAGRAPDRPGDTTPAPRFWRYLNKLITCPWCAGFWVALALTLAYYRCILDIWPHTPFTWFTFAVAWFGLSWLSAILTDWLDSPPPPRQLVHSGAVHTIQHTNTGQTPQH